MALIKTYTFDKDKIEIFKKFASKCPYSIDLQTIKLKSPPEPDICCPLEDGGSIYFELKEVIDEDMARNIKLRPKFRKACGEALKTFPEPDRAKFEASYRNKIIFIAINEESKSIVRKGGKILKDINFKKVAKCFIKFLMDKGFPPSGIYKADDYPLGDDIRHIEISTSSSSSSADPHFAWSRTGGAMSTPLLDRIEDAFKSKYQTYRSRCELLVYFDFQTPVLISLDNVKKYISDNIGKSPFKKVWVYSFSDDKIFLSYP